MLPPLPPIKCCNILLFNPLCALYYTIIKILIRPDGRITGADTNGCGYDGIAGIIDPARNAYRFDMLVSSCNRVDGEFTGMGFLMTSIEEDDTLHLQVSNDDWGLYMPIVRDSKKVRGT